MESRSSTGSFPPAGPADPACWGTSPPGVLLRVEPAQHWQGPRRRPRNGNGSAANPPACAQVFGLGGWLASWGPRAAQSCLAAVATGGVERLNEAVEHNLERAMFLFLPLLALIMKLLYLKPPRYYVEHLLFFLHSHAFVFVILAAGALLNMTTSSAVALGPVDTAITIYIPIYFYRAMRRVYGQGRWRTLGKLAALGVAYFFLGVLMLVATVSFSFLML